MAAPARKASADQQHDHAWRKFELEYIGHGKTDDDDRI